MESIYKFTPPNHLFITSQTGGGKTWLGSNIFHNLKYRSLFFNYNLENYFKKDVEIDKFKTLPVALKKSRRIGVYSDNIKLIKECIEYIWELKRYNKEFAKQDIFLFLDEIQKYSQLDIITDVFNRGRKWKIHGIAMCRQIQEMKNLRIISECQDMIFLRMNEIGISTLRKNYQIKIPDYVLHYINFGKYEGNEFKSYYYSAHYDGITWFIYNKDGEFVDSYNSLTLGIGEIENVENKHKGKRQSEDTPSKKSMESISNPTKRRNNKKV